MDSKSFRTLQILDEVSKNGNFTQRDLSKRLGVALGLTNLYLKRLIKRGYLKVVNIKVNRLKYELTPQGIAQKTALSYRYIQNSFWFYRDIRNKIKSSFETLMLDGCRKVVFYGAGEITEIAYLSLREVGLELAGIVDGQSVDKNLCGYKILSPESLKVLDFDRVIVTILESDEDVENALSTIGGVDKGKITLLEGIGDT
ncbi:MAG: winged helix-turn-helix transcriptional regulator [Thermodesulfobacteriota bacterium]